MAYIYIIRNIHTNRIIDVKMSAKKILFVGREEKLEKKYVSTQNKNNLYRKYKRRIGKILRRPTQ